MSADSVLDQIIELPKMTFDEIKQYWKQIFNEDPPPRSKKHILIKKIAYRIQEIAYGVNEDIDIRLDHHAEQYFGSGK